MTDDDQSSQSSQSDYPAASQSDYPAASQSDYPARICLLNPDDEETSFVSIVLRSHITKC